MDTTVTCPACHKADQSGAACSRCGCDLTLLHHVAVSAAMRLTAARQALAARDYRAALNEAAQSWRLCHRPASATLAFLAAAGLGETQSALLWRRRAKT